MTRHWRIVAALILGLTILFGFYAWIIAPRLMEQQAQAALNALGFNATDLPEPVYHLGALTYSNVSLDTDGIDQIGTLTLRLNSPWSAEMVIDNLSLSGEMDAGAIDFTGFVPHSFDSQDITALAGITRITLRHASIGILSQDLGGIQIQIDAQASKDSGTADDPQFSVQGRFTSEQLTFAADGNFTGKIGAKGGHIDSSIDDGRFDAVAMNLKLTRISGSSQLTLGTASPYIKLLADIRAGGLSVHDTLWQTVSATYEYTDGEQSLVIEAKSLRQPDIEANVSLSQNPSLITDESAPAQQPLWLIDAQISGPAQTDVLRFIKDNPAFTLAGDSKTARLTFQDIPIDFTILDQPPDTATPDTPESAE